LIQADIFALGKRIVTKTRNLEIFEPFSIFVFSNFRAFVIIFYFCFRELAIA